MRPYVRFDDEPYYSPLTIWERKIRKAMFQLLLWLVGWPTVFFMHYRSNGDPNGQAMIGAVLMGLPLALFCWVVLTVLRFIFRR